MIVIHVLIMITKWSGIWYVTCDDAMIWYATFYVWYAWFVWVRKQYTYIQCIQYTLHTVCIWYYLTIKPRLSFLYPSPKCWSSVVFRASSKHWVVSAQLWRTGRQWWGQDRHSWSAFVLLLQLPGSCHGRRGVLLLILNVDRQVQNESNMTTCYLHLYHSHTHHHAHTQAHRFIHLISLRHWLLCRETIEGLNDVASIFFLPVSCESNFSKSLADASQSMTCSTFERAYWVFIDAMIWPCMGWDFRIRICMI